ncbi:hypothetical protein EJ05DRAFT_512141 [Pseudovirgaria hyperparasitica]|uniref:UBZ4-type domain-containing protein n=1 Tax=Pseudovirgaria hyperparasitica TaxID=470096 RepID=A0A6A6W1R4_9PEZI|nr:uncharacterized protein EJ05DRAFT_512141 [Pseudovirgaria hyperparasitica]KAF2756485.1 hypothetical protein EJ05DRAFT_512141 [Pseudovirgaria hyperparasitica]
MSQNHRATRGNRTLHRNNQQDRRARTSTNPTNVPRTSQVVSGAAVSIVLKADQPTGREVQGIVQDLLTRGDHPRGIKVRLVDGRVGRVQRMASEMEILPAQEGTETSNATTIARGRGGCRGGGRGYGIGSRYRDVREEDDGYTYMEGRDQGRSLADYLDAAERRHAALSGQSATRTSTDPQNNDAALTLATCPICNDFEGDETAVTHHVNGHFA